MDSERFIAHIRKADKSEQYVDEHNDQVAELASAIAESYGLAKIAKLAGRHHDDGKNTPEFTAYIRAAVEGKRVVRGSVIHSTHGAILVNELASLKRNSRLTAEIVRTAIMSHHGLRDCLSLDGDVVFVEAAENIADSYESVKETVYQRYGRDFINQEFIDAGLDTHVITKNIQELQKKSKLLGSPYFYLAMFTRLITSIVIDADRTDTACFEDKRALPQRRALDERKEMWKKYLVHYESQLEKLQEGKKTSSLDPYRGEISRACAEFDGGEAGIFRLVVPCGAGKTLAALRYALHTARRYGKERIFYIAPFNSILEQNATEIAKFIGDPDAVLEHHSNIIFSAEENKDKSEDEKRYQLLTENWAQSPVVATTAVQFLNTLFAGQTSCIRRMQALGNSVIILDEIQALPIKVLKLFNGAMNFLASFCKSSVVLCSATQPLLDRVDHYRILPPRSIIENEEKYNEAFRRVQIVNCMKEQGYSREEAADFIVSQLESTRSVLAIVNTKRSAREIFKHIQDKLGNETPYRIFHLSTNMCPAHRSRVLKHLRERLKDTDLGEKIICISTSLIEAGVDVSFERVVRSLTGLDSIVQAAGRCNRNYETSCGIVSIINLRDERTSGQGYLKEAQKATQELLYSIKISPEGYPGGALSKDAMEEYYARYFQPLLEEMAYRLKFDPEHTLLDLLTSNPSGQRGFEEKYPQERPPELKQAFKEAGGAFSVIDDDGKVDVFIEYDEEARKRLQKLREATTLQEKRTALRQLQPYTVQLRDNDWIKTQRTALAPEDGGILVLPPGYYDGEYGVDETLNIEMETLII
ncbi:CRISPR-associated helicase Cas3' [Desulforamulus ruminis]|uniref:CRISPR-associated helicase Cas3' n=1 Tax=Desulforamulus ruminis TaxID=1564 RepID=UPI002354C00A|nr:CRISPR-associated helicase Cas3' [Desulforamulus ruminis]